jgi:hypothetical protein
MLLSLLLALVAANDNVCGMTCERRLRAMGHTVNDKVCGSACKRQLEQWPGFVQGKLNAMNNARAVRDSALAIWIKAPGYPFVSRRNINQATSYKNAEYRFKRMEADYNAVRYL